MPYLYKIDEPGRVDLSTLSTDSIDPINKDDAAVKVLQLSDQLSALQEALYASGTHSVLIVLQAMDTGGKDGTISHVFESINPQGCAVTSFKQPTPLEQSHDFLWRAHAAVPPSGMMAIFNRSHYEDVLVVRVHDLVPKSTWSKRYVEINQFESILTRHNTIVLKFFLHITKEEQRKRLLAREDDAAKSWKLSAADWHEREYWDKYTQAYEDVLSKTATNEAPWFVVPGNHKWYRNYAIAHTLVNVLGKYKAEWDKELVALGTSRKAELDKMRAENPKLAAEAQERDKKKHRSK